VNEIGGETKGWGKAHADKTIGTTEKVDPEGGRKRSALNVSRAGNWEEGVGFRGELEKSGRQGNVDEKSGDGTSGPQRQYVKKSERREIKERQFVTRKGYIA